MTDAARLRASLAASRAQQGLGTDAAKEAGFLPEEALPTPAELARAQVQEAIARGRLDLSGAPRWPWADVDAIVGPMLPGELWVVGAITGNGKSTFLMSAMDAWAARQCSTLYIPLETDPQEMRRRWAAWKLGLDVVAMLRNDWAALPEGSQEAHEATMAEQILDPCVHFAPPKYITMSQIRRWVEWAYHNLGIRQVILDHFQRVDHGDDRGAAHRLAVGGTARMLRDLARELQIVIVAAGQLHRLPDPLDAFKAPALSRIKDAGAIGEEASGVLVLSKRLRKNLTKEDMAAYREGHREEWELADQGVMVATLRKHRLDGTAVDRRAGLRVVNGRVVDFPSRYWPTPTHPREER